MTQDQRGKVHDRDHVYRLFFEEMQREYLRTLVTDELIEEHRRQPLGQHSEPLERLLIFFRRSPQKDRYAIRRDETSHRYRVVALPARRGELPVAVEDRDYGTPEEAYHAVFLRRVQDLLKVGT